MALPSLPSLPLRCTQPHMPPARQRPGSSSAAARTAQPPPLQLQPLPAGRARPSQGQSQPGTLSHEGCTHWNPGMPPRSGAQLWPAGCSAPQGRRRESGAGRRRSRLRELLGAPGAVLGTPSPPESHASLLRPEAAAGGPRAGARPGPPGAPGRSSSGRQRRGASGGERRPLQWDVRPGPASEAESAQSSQEARYPLC